VNEGVNLHTTHIHSHCSIWLIYQNLFLFFFWQYWGLNLCFLGKCSTSCASPPTLFAFLGHFADSISLFDKDLLWIAIFLHTLPYSWVDRCVSRCLACWLRWNFADFLPRLVLNCDPLDFCLPSSWDCRCEPPYPICNSFLRSWITLKTVVFLSGLLYQANVQYFCFHCRFSSKIRWSWVLSS
jgi:hypothetical protein